MSQNRSSAVMQQRREPPDSLDFFPTQPWGTRAFCEEVTPHIPGFSFDATAWDSACGRLDMARPLGEYFARIQASDVFDYGVGAKVHDFRRGSPFDEPPDWVISNPPFNLAASFIYCGLKVARVGVAALCRLAFLESDTRYKGLFRDRPPALIAQFVERLPMFKGRLDPSGGTATAYAWFVWLAAETTVTRFLWIPPCRKRLEHREDYDGYAIPAADLPAARATDLFREAAP